ncbi:hypothetical protein [Pseudoclavibacter endophyticus]|uniref:hypothetical protein n=1 Tax=Pseudoclavibacter endophyticus TaxID=1778590 RepID=UPI00166ECDB2|nr:hypothetical protein [Pseudoclavibacter endophyticus]
MIGRLPEGTRLWGGPYTFTQLGVAGAVLSIAAATRAAWSTGSIVIDLLIITGVVWGAAFAARMLPTSRLNPGIVVLSALTCALAPRLGTYRGRPVRRPGRSLLGGSPRARRST